MLNTADKEDIHEIVLELMRTAWLRAQIDNRGWKDIAEVFKEKVDSVLPSNLPNSKQDTAEENTIMKWLESLDKRVEKILERTTPKDTGKGEEKKEYTRLDMLNIVEVCKDVLETGADFWAEGWLNDQKEFKSQPSNPPNSEQDTEEEDYIDLLEKIFSGFGEGISQTDVTDAIDKYVHMRLATVRSERDAWKEMCRIAETQVQPINGGEKTWAEIHKDAYDFAMNTLHWVDRDATHFAKGASWKWKQQSPDGEKKEWISVKDKWPPRHQNVWCLNKDGVMFEGRICFGMHEPFFTYPRGDGNASNTAPNWINVTHWMSLPDKP